jgi:hypothetical protein
VSATGAGSEGRAVDACSFLRALVIRRARSGWAGSTCEANQRAATVGRRLHQLRTRVVVERRVVNVSADHAVAHQTFYEGVAVVEEQRNSEGSTGRESGALSSR